jgi:CRP-like cAMP-binding protein
MAIGTNDLDRETGSARCGCPIMTKALRHDAIIHLDQLALIHGEVLFLPGSPISSIFLIEKGNILTFSPFGQRSSRSMVSGQLIGMEDLLSHGQWSSLGVAHGPTRLRVFCAEQLRACIDRSPMAHQTLLRELACG